MSNSDPSTLQALAQLVEILADPARRVEIRIHVRELPPPDQVDWQSTARRFAQTLRRERPGIGNDALAPLVHQQLKAAGVHGRGGRVPSLPTILRRGL